MPEPEGLAKLVRDGLFLASSRTYAEQYIEPFIRHKYGLREPTGGDHDAVDDQGRQFEIKASKVMRSRDNLAGPRSLIQRILFENESSPTSRMFPFAEAEEAKYDANIQNVKRDHFDTLIYVLLFSDCIKIFFAPTEEIFKGGFEGWSDKHGRYDQEGKSGQFGIRKKTIRWHLNRYLRDTVSYEELAAIYTELSQ